LIFRGLAGRVDLQIQEMHFYYFSQASKKAMLVAVLNTVLWPGITLRRIAGAASESLDRRKCKSAYIFHQV